MTMTEADVDHLAKLMIEEAQRLATSENRRYIVGLFMDHENQDYAFEAVPEVEGLEDQRITPAWIITEAGEVIACDPPAQS